VVVTRREFLILVCSVTARFVTGCGSSSSISESETSFQVTVRLQGLTKTISIRHGQTVLDAIKSAFSYRKNADDSTTINGQTGSWCYTVNGAEPKDYAGDHPAMANDAIALQQI